MSAPAYGATREDWDTFTLLYGLTADLLPVVSNPQAEISEHSTMADLGKTPSRYNGQGKVVGIPKWSQYQATGRDIDRWMANPDYGICVQTREVRAIDVDVDDLFAATEIFNFILNHLCARLPYRMRSNSGKFLLAFRLPGEFTKRKMKVAGGIIEFLATGQQFIAVGTHPSGERYKWEGDDLPDDFPTLTADQFESLWAALVARFAIEEVKPPRATGDAIAAPAGAVPLADLVAALDAIPNSGADELAYDDWLAVVMALHYETGASDEGLALAHKFSSRAAKYNPDEVELEWSRIKGASHSGKSVTGGTILARARGHGWAEDVSGDFDVVAPEVRADGKAEPAPRPAFARKPKTGEILVTMDNMVKAIARPDMVGMHLALDTFRDEIMYSEDEGQNWQPFKDADYTRLRIALERCGFAPPSKDATRDALILVAERNAFDSAQVWLGRLQHDGVPRIDTFLSRYMGAEDTPYTRAVSRYIWTALAGRVLEPGCKADMAPILVGKQGVRKSSGVAAIAPALEFFCEVSFGEKEDDLSRKMRGRLVAELAELKGLASRDSDHVKAWMTKRYEDWTPKYREFNTVFPRRLLVFGTTNKDEFLVDETGNRRYLPAKVGVTHIVDVDAIERDRDQLWAEGRDIFDLVGVEYQEAEKLAIDVHDDYMMRDPWEPFIQRWLQQTDDITDQSPGTCEFLLVHEVLEGALRMDAKNCKRVDEMRVGEVLRAIGYERRQKRVDGRMQYIYVNPQFITVTTASLRRHYPIAEGSDAES